MKRITFYFLVVFALFLQSQNAYGYEDTCASGGPNNVGQTSCTFNATKNGVTYHLVDSPVYYCKTHYTAATACAVAASPNDGLVPLSPTALSGSWAHACGNSWGSYSASITGIAANLYGVCGSAASTTPTATPPTDNFCSVGSIDTALYPTTGVSDQGSFWTWNCQGLVPGTYIEDVSCYLYKKVNGVCGTAADGAEATEIPDRFFPTPDATRVCRVSSVTFPTVTSTTNGYSWTCSGYNGGDNASCFAPKASNAVCNNNILNTCTAGTPIPSSSGQPGTWACQGSNGGVAQCVSANAVCGSATGEALTNGNPPAGAAACALGSLGGAPVWHLGGYYSWQCNVTGDSVAVPPALCPNKYYCDQTGTTPDLLESFTYCKDNYGFRCSDGSVDWTGPTYCENNQGMKCGPGASASCQSGGIIGVCGVSPDTCSTGSAVAPSAPDTPTKSLWYCHGSNGIPDTLCSADIAGAVTGDCGPAAKVYFGTELFPSGGYCDSGNASPTPTDPIVGGQSTWRCFGSDTNSSNDDSGTCVASRSSGGPVSLNTLIVTPIINSGGVCNVNLSSVFSNYLIPPLNQPNPHTLCTLRNQYDPNPLLTWNSANIVNPSQPIGNTSQSNVTRDTIFTFKCEDFGTTGASTGNIKTKTAVCRVNIKPIETN